ncbi:hypothetical protein LTR78_005199 [Recurvomyces mirabilis]|uniref:Uncharacterized protein n=1 Tax=Recurvomyces mirabilis TaxID=574656 RepID=A0AAE0WN55_9PEZI|nr:hypothetical protein LTR78_005199 [Recurvomyces mirabilis]KAK5157749.1 hypothetical protein LTS14_003671 [Recurvomyces mirabilis]
MAGPVTPTIEEDNTCTICFDGKHDAHRLQISGDDICGDCFKDELVPKFEEAIKNEINWPVSWASQSLSPSTDFPRHLFSDDFLARWTKRMLEYSVTPESRIYCGQCKQPALQVYAATAATSPHELVDGHHCPDPAPADESIEGQTRGKDYQLCPGCKQKVNLTSGCNAIPCQRCNNKYFCYICGVQADHHITHWLLGNPCPRWLQPDDPRASFDGTKPTHIQDATARGRLPEIERRALAAAVRRDRLVTPEEEARWEERRRHWNSVKNEIHAVTLTAYDQLLEVEFPAPQHVTVAKQNAVHVVAEHMRQLAFNVAIYIFEGNTNITQLSNDHLVRLMQGHEKLLKSQREFRLSLGKLSHGPWKEEMVRIWDVYLAVASNRFEVPDDVLEEMVARNAVPGAD